MDAKADGGVGGIDNLTQQYAFGMNWLPETERYPPSGRNLGLRDNLPRQKCLFP